MVVEEYLHYLRVFKKKVNDGGKCKKKFSSPFWFVIQMILDIFALFFGVFVVVCFFYYVVFGLADQGIYFSSFWGFLDVVVWKGVILATTISVLTSLCINIVTYFFLQKWKMIAERSTGKNSEEQSKTCFQAYCGCMNKQ